MIGINCEATELTMIITQPPLTHNTLTEEHLTRYPDGMSAKRRTHTERTPSGRTHTNSTPNKRTHTNSTLDGRTLTEGRLTKEHKPKVHLMEEC